MTYLHDVRMCSALTEFTEDPPIILTYPGEYLAEVDLHRIVYRLAEVDDIVLKKTPTTHYIMHSGVERLTAAKGGGWTKKMKKQQRRQDEVMCRTEKAASRFLLLLDLVD
ncbi:Hypothetical predicted protein [Scomber scombrus]|uniref:Uncharacterized protein n=1 Tax=Scomber scombrus TaxID=13677 RepID=A0AAV1Q965_SCOSC